MCHESSGTGLGETIGIGKGTVTLEDFDQADLIMVIGQNPGTNHPRMLTALQRAVRKGAHIVSVKPLREAGLVAFAHPQEVRGVLGAATTLAETHVPVRVNGDVALLNGMWRARPGRGRGEDAAVVGLIRERTEGFEAFASGLAETPWERWSRQRNPPRRDGGVGGARPRVRPDDRLLGDGAHNTRTASRMCRASWCCSCWAATRAAWRRRLPGAGHSNVQAMRDGHLGAPTGRVPRSPRSTLNSACPRAWLRHGRSHRGHARGRRESLLRDGRHPERGARHARHGRRAPASHRRGVTVNRGHLVAGETSSFSLQGAERATRRPRATSLSPSRTPWASSTPHAGRSRRRRTTCGRRSPS